jgi:peptidoglycan/xylan/chitin deacetylase (PgdA/CDA1 family)
MRLLIVNYHYIRDVKPPAGIYPLSVAEFRSQVETLGKHYEFTSQSDLLGMLDADSFPDGNFCLLTFDDSLAEQWDALDVLFRLSIPALCFATTDWIVERRPHDVHKRHYIFSQLDEKRLLDILHDRFQLGDQPLDEAVIAEQYSYDTPGMRRIKFFLNFVLSEVERRKAVDALFSQVEPDERRFTGSLYMSSEQLIALAERGMLGTHTCSHSPLATLRPADMRSEIATSKRVLEELTGNPIRSISYPYGGSTAVSQDVASTSRDEGLRLGLTMFRGINDDSDLRGNSLLLKRVDTNDAPGGKLRSEKYVP